MVVEVALAGQARALGERTDALHRGIDLGRIADHEAQLAVAARNIADRDARIAAAQLGADEIGVAQELWQPLEQRRENLVPGGGTTIRSQRGRVRDRRRRDVEAETDHDAWR